MSRFIKTVEEFDKKPPTTPTIGKLHPIRYRNFLVEHGRMVGENKTILHFAQVRMEPNLFMEILRKTFEGRYIPKISYNSNVILGGYAELDEQDSFAVVWEESLSDGMLGWIKNKVKELDEKLST